MSSVIPYTKTLLVQRIRQHIVNDFPSSDFNITENETLLYIDQAIAYNVIGQMYLGAKVDGSLATPEGYLNTYLLPALVKDSITGYWTTTLPQPPVSLPLGYSITRWYFAKSGLGVGLDVIMIKSKRVARRKYMPRQYGVNGWIEGSTVFLEASNNTPLSGNNFYVTLLKTRTDNINEVLNLPDDAIETIFNNVVAKMKDRLSLPKDVIQDDISEGASNVSKV
jgi:hypothetical protein